MGSANLAVRRFPEGLHVDRSDAIRDQISILSKVEGFFEASVMFALLRLDLFEALGRRAVSISQLSRKTGADAGRLGRLLRCAATMELLESLDGEHFRLSKPSRTVLLKGSPENYLGDWLLRMAQSQLRVVLLNGEIYYTLRKTQVLVQRWRVPDYTVTRHSSLRTNRQHRTLHVQTEITSH